MRVLSLPALSGLFLFAACTNLLGIDGDYSLDNDVTGGTAGDGGGRTGGVGGTGNASGGGGNSTTGGAGGSTGGGGGSGGNDGGGSGGIVFTPDADAPCPTDQKRCFVNGSVQCVIPDPSVGCDLVTCDPCDPSPIGGYAICTSDHQCDFECHSGYMRSPDGNSCDPVPDGGSTGGAGGTGGQGGTGGSPWTCDPSKCLDCGPFPGCCTLISMRCGCQWVAVCG